MPRTQVISPHYSDKIFSAVQKIKGLAGTPDNFSASELAIIKTEVLSSVSSIVKIIIADRVEFDQLANWVGDVIDDLKQAWGPSNLGVFDSAHPDFSTAVAYVAAWSNATPGAPTSFSQSPFEKGVPWRAHS